jgi:hypothetical protein
MKINWTKGLPPKEKEEMLVAIRAARMPLERLEKLTGEFISELATTLPGDFDTPQWALKRAYEDGQVYAYKRIATLLSERK